jgi:hypothetical protein
MRYLLLCCFDEAAWLRLPEADRGAIMRDYAAWTQALERSGQHLASVKLQPSATATTVREKNGHAVFTDGPFAETKEQVGGYHLLQCKDLDQALALAARIPTLRAGGTVEVRPLHPDG